MTAANPGGSRAVLLDLDGTLTDSALGITRCVAHALEVLGHAAPPADELREHVGPPLRDTFAQLLGTRETQLVDDAVAAYRERYTRVGIFESTLHDGIDAALRALAAGGVRLLVATSKPTEYARRIVDHFGLSASLDDVHGSEMDGTRCDKAALLAHVLHQQGLSPQRTIMVGDRHHDADGARANAVRCLGVAWGYGSEAELQEAGVVEIVATPSELPAAVARHLG